MRRHPKATEAESALFQMPTPKARTQRVVQAPPPAGSMAGCRATEMLNFNSACPDLA